MNQNDIKKLIDEGFMSVEAVFYIIKKNLCQVKGLKELKVDIILIYVMKYYQQVSNQAIFFCKKERD